MKVTIRTTHLAAAACIVLAACQRAPGATDGAVADTIPNDSTFAPTERVSLPTDRIYFTLTSHEWYKRGQPLVHDGHGYRPAGMPIAASLTDMERVGEYGGVEYYALAADSTQTVYVPVFQGYWQAFRLDPNAPVAAAPAPSDSAATVSPTADPAAASPADSIAAPDSALDSPLHGATGD